jgi:hypothetical protein
VAWSRSASSTIASCRSLLLSHGAHHPGMAVADHGDVVVAVQVSAAGRVEQPGPFAADQVHGIVVEQRGPGECPAAALRQRGGPGPAVRQPAAGFAEPLSDRVQARGLDAVQEGWRAGLAVRGVGGVVRVDPEPPRGERDVGGEPGRDQVREQPGLLVVQRRHRGVAADHDLRRADRVGAPVQHIRDGDRQVAHQRGVGHVPEVDDAADLEVLAEQQVVQAEVGVDHLGPQPGQHRGYLGLEPVQDACHLRPASGVGDMAEQWAQRGQAGDVPEDPVVRRGVEEAPQRPAQAGRGLPDGPDRPGAERCRGHGAPGQEREQPHRVCPAIRPGHLGPGVPRGGRDHPHHRQPRIHLLDVAQGGRLHVQNRPRVRRIGDLEKEPLPGGGVHPEVLVPLAGQGGEGARDAEGAPEELPGGLVAERGRRTRQRVARRRVTGLRVAHHRARALHHRPEEYLAVARTS